jgi:excisionase family DNA binding protein
MMDEIYTPEQVAKRLQVSYRTVLEMLRSKRLRGAKLGPRTWRISGEAIADFIRGSETKAAAPEPDITTTGSLTNALLAASSAQEFRAVIWRWRRYAESQGSPMTDLPDSIRFLASRCSAKGEEELLRKWEEWGPKETA